MKKLILCTVLLMILLTGCSRVVSQEEYDKLKNDYEELSRSNEVAKELYSQSKTELEKYTMNDNKIDAFSWAEACFGKGNVHVSNLENSLVNGSTTDYVQLVVNTPFDNTIDGIRSIHDLMLNSIPTMSEFMSYDKAAIKMLDNQGNYVMEYIFTKSDDGYESEVAVSLGLHDEIIEAFQ